MIPVVYVFSYFVAAFALALVIPAIVAIGLGEGPVGLDFLISAALTIFVAGAMMLSLRGRERRLRPAQRYLLAVMLWLLLPVISAVPLLMTVDGVTVVDAYFESVSGLTTTGATVLPPPEQMPKGVVLLMALTQWFGGAMTLIVVALALAPAGVGGLPETHARTIEHGGLPERRRLVLLMRDVFPIYLGATALTFLLLAGTELEAYEALCLAFTAVSTGGFTPQSIPISEYVPTFGVAILVLAMMYGATNVLWQRDMLTMRRRRSMSHRESLWAIGLCLAFGFVAALIFFRAAGQGVGVAVRDGIFTATSLITTSGFQIRHAGFEVFPVVVVVVLLAIGAASFSTAGGIKLFRVGAMLVQGYRELNRLVYPHGVRRSQLGGQPYDIQVMKAIWSGFLTFVLATLTLSLYLAWQEVPYEGAVLAALSAMSNAGPVYSSDWTSEFAWPAYSEMAGTAKLAMCLGMIVGRVEILAVLGLFVYVARRG